MLFILNVVLGNLTLLCKYLENYTCNTFLVVTWYWHKTKKLNCQKSIHNFFVTGDSATPGSTRSESRTAETSKMEYFVIIVNGLQPLTIITKRTILDVMLQQF